MGKKTTEVPVCAINPMLGTLRFEWFMHYLSLGLKKNDKLNVLTIHNAAYVNDRKKYGVLRASFHAKRLTNALRANIPDCVIGEYNMNTLIIVSEDDIQDDVIAAVKPEHFSVTVGATASLTGDNEFSIANRALLALQLAQRKQNDFQTL